MNLSNPNFRVVLTIVVIVIIAIVLTRLFRWMFTRVFRGTQDPTRFKFFRNAVSFIIWLIALASIIYTIPEFRAVAISMLAGAGILIALLGFAAQQAFANIVSGLFIVIFKPYRIGDLVQVGEFPYGVVEDITLRHTVITNFENQRIIIPNSVISSESIINASIGDPKLCRWIEVGISYDSDIELACRIMAEEAMKHPDCIDVRTQEDIRQGKPQVIVRVLQFGDFSIDLRAFVWTDDPMKSYQMHSDINKAIKKRFDEEGVEIPFPYRTVVYKKDLPANTKLEEA